MSYKSSSEVTNRPMGSSSAFSIGYLAQHDDQILVQFPKWDLINLKRFFPSLTRLSTIFHNFEEFSSQIPSKKRNCVCFRVSFSLRIECTSYLWYTSLSVIAAFWSHHQETNLTTHTITLAYMKSRTNLIS
jgi:hypothetical protein